MSLCPLHKASAHSACLLSRKGLASRPTASEAACVPYPQRKHFRLHAYWDRKGSVETYRAGFSATPWVLAGGGTSDSQNWKGWGGVASSLLPRAQGGSR